MKKFLHSLCTILGALLLIITGFVLFIGWYTDREVYIPDHSLLVIDFKNKFSETMQTSLIDEFMGTEKISYIKLLQSIEFATVDERIDGIVAKIDTSDLELAQIQEVAETITKFKKSGKKTYVFSKGFGNLGQGNREYYLASFFDKIYMQPHTTIGLTGMDIEVPFARNLMNKIGIKPEFYSRYEYKNAMVSLTDAKMSQPYKENMYNLASNLMNTLEDGITHNRALKSNIKNIINQAPLTAEQGKELNLIDDILYLQELEHILKKEGAKHFVDITDYADLIQPNSGDLPQIAILNLNGLINDGKSETDFDGEFSIGSDDVIADIEHIKELPNLRALIVRINSPGGSYSAADEIYFALKKLKTDKKIPIIISQSGYAASGGYYISLAGDKIIAEPTTITGSIGVLGGKFSLAELWKKIGINWEDIKIGNNADILSINKPFSENEKRIFNASLDEVYHDFTSKVVENRHLTEDIDKIARGRVWTGEQAQKLGLIDILGGYDKAFYYARVASALKDNEKFTTVTYPKEKSFKEKLYDMIISGNISSRKIFSIGGVDIRNLKLFKYIQYDTVMLPFNLNI